MTDASTTATVEATTTTTEARHMKPGMKFRHNNRTFTAEKVGKNDGTVKIHVEGYRCPLDFYVRQDLEVLNEVDEAQAA